MFLCRGKHRSPVAQIGASPDWPFNVLKESWLEGFQGVNVLWEIEYLQTRTPDQLKKGQSWYPLNPLSRMTSPVTFVEKGVCKSSSPHTTDGRTILVILNLNSDRGNFMVTALNSRFHFDIGIKREIIAGLPASNNVDSVHLSNKLYSQHGQISWLLSISPALHYLAFLSLCQRLEQQNKSPTQIFLSSISFSVSRLTVLADQRFPPKKNSLTGFWRSNMKLWSPGNPQAYSNSGLVLKPFWIQLSGSAKQEQRRETLIL